MLSTQASQVHAIPSAAPLTQAAQAFLESGIGALIAVDDAGQPEGMLTDRDILRRAIAPEGTQASELLVRDVMSAPLITARMSDDIDKLLAILEEHGLRRLPLEDDHGRIAGLVSFDDLVEQLAELSGGVATAVFRQLRTARSRGTVQHVRDEVEQGFTELHERLAYANWSARETLLRDLDLFRDKMRELFRPHP